MLVGSVTAIFSMNFRKMKLLRFYFGKISDIL